jgi:hypothetical protein
VLTFHNDNARTGLQPRETVLTPANVSSATFGKLYNFAVDGNLYAQPLFVGGYTMADGKAHNVLFAATAHGTVYAFDADNKNPASGALWNKSLIPTGEQPITPADYGCDHPSPESVIIGTPVIDREGGALYVVSRTRIVAADGIRYFQRIHALNLADGSEKFSGPTVIQASVPGTGWDSVNGVVPFDQRTENQRAALVLSKGMVYIAWASHCDIDVFHGWVIGYNATDLTQQTAIYNDTPNSGRGGIWMGAGGITADAAGNLYVAAGNGVFDSNNNGLNNLANAAIKLVPGTAGGLTAVDYFSPSNNSYLDEDDLDFGTSEMMLIPSVPGGAPDLLVATDKTGEFYILDPNNLGKYRTGTHGLDGLNGDVQDFSIYTFLFSQPAFYNGVLYVGGQGQPMQSFPFQPGTGGAKGSFNILAATITKNTFSPVFVKGGTSPVISSSSTSGAPAIVWALDLSGAFTVLHAYEAANIANELYNSDQAPAARDQGVPPVKFQSPVIADGHVFVAGHASIAVYGLLSK